MHTGPATAYPHQCCFWEGCCAAARTSCNTRTMRPPSSCWVASFFSDHADRGTGRNSQFTAAATLSKARLESPRCRRMNLVIEDGGNLADSAICRNGRPSVRMAARRLSDGAIRCTFITILPPGWHVATLATLNVTRNVSFGEGLQSKAKFSG